jgi:hypothetical protein
MSGGRFSVEWHKREGSAQQPPNPAFPKGMFVDGAAEGVPACIVDLPYPAPGLGLHVARCLICGYTAAITAAGRPDDPVRARLPCKSLLRA